MTRFWAVTVVSAFGRLVAIAGTALSVGVVVAYVSRLAISAGLHGPASCAPR